ncbi:MAG: TlpA family protein disulfide reductase [Methylococcaceae bacterium]|nr:TlpA family protein disulfide reductase [Methylococcaceae bacterium]
MNLRILFICVSLALPFWSLSSQAAETEQRPAPHCALTTFTDKQSLDLKQFKGQVVYVDFWASWCGPCIKSFPFMNSLDHDLKEQGLQVIGVNLDENVDEAKLFLEQTPASFTIATDTEERCAKSFGVKAMPSSYLIDRNGVIRHLHLGFRPGEAQEFRALVEKLLAESKQAGK